MTGQRGTEIYPAASPFSLTHPPFSVLFHRTLCGTPNYIAPEILDSKKGGHSYEVDIWSIGCILYTMLVGKPPFETQDIKMTYRKIKMNEYRIPSSLNLTHEARDLISICLHSEPTQRPSPLSILQHPFLSRHYVPASLPVSALQMRPDLTGIPAATAYYLDEAAAAAAAATSVAVAPAKQMGGQAERLPLGNLNGPAGAYQEVSGRKECVCV